MGIIVTNIYLGYATVLLQIVGAVLIVAFLMHGRVSIFRTIDDLMGKWGLWVAFAAALVGAFLTLYYSQVLEVPPCDLCWWQRIFLYPQVILLGLAARKRDPYMADYSIILSVFGAAIALYHHLLQMFPNSLPCPATGVSCAQRFLFEFGYITYPLMAFFLFAFLIIVMLFVRSKRES